MHIAHLIGTANVGGVQKLIEQTVSTNPLSPVKHSVICLISANGNFRNKFQERHILVYECPMVAPDLGKRPYSLWKFLRKSKILSSYIRLEHVLNDLQVDIVHSHIPYYSLMQILAAHKAKLPFLWTIHGEFSTSFIERNILRFIVRKKGIMITADSEGVLQVSAAKFIFENKKVQIIYPGIKLKQVQAGYLKRYVTRENLKYASSDTILIGTVGRLFPDKGFDILIKAIALLPKKFQHVRIVIAGQGGQRNELQKIIDELDVSHQVQLVGFVEDIPAFLSALDIYVQPSRTEAFGISLVEAMAIGLPIVATNVGGIPEIIQDQVTGLLIKPNDPEQLMLAILSIITNRPLQEKLARNARLKSEKFDFLQYLEKYNELYKKLLSV